MVLAAVWTSSPNPCHYLKPMKFVIPSALVVAAVFLTWSSSDSRSAADDPEEPNPKVVALLEEIVEVRERMAEGYLLRWKAGEETRPHAAAIALAKARLDLARERRDEAEVMELLETIVGLHEKDVAIQREAFRGGRRTGGEINRSEIGLLRARVRLEKERAQTGR